MVLNSSVWWREVWDWSRVKDAVRGLSGRLGFERGKELRFFRLRIDLETGEVFDEVLGRYLSERERYGLYFILYKYSQANREVEESREYASLLQICPAIHCPMLKQNMRAFEKVFGFDKNLLYKAAEPFGYREADVGDVAVKIYVLPRVPITIGIWLGEEGIPPSAIVLYDKSVTHYLDCEAASILAGATLARLAISLALKLGTDVSGIGLSYRYQCTE